MKTVYYDSTEEDFVTSKNQKYQLKDNYKWIHNNVFYIIFSYLLYYPFALFGFIYTKLILRVKIKNRKVLKGYKGYYYYSNHTQEIGDIFNPVLVNFPRRPYFICSPANLGIPILGKLLPMLGALPIPSSIHAMIKFNEAVKTRSKNHPLIIYPEAHLWPWATEIREFKGSSFKYPVENNLPIFIATTTYQKSKIFKKPKITIYLDGPYFKDGKLSRKENISKLHDIAYDVMIKRSKNSNYSYIEYKKK